MYYKDGKVFNSVQAVRNELKDVSLPHLVNDSQLEDLGFLKVVDTQPVFDVATQYITEGNVELIGGVPTKNYIVVDYTVEELQAKQADAIAQLVQHFTDVTTAYIEAKVQEYNKANGVAFKDIDAFTKYAVNILSPYHEIANRFISYADKIWTTVRTYQATATTVPTDAEFKALLDSVVF